MNSLKMTTHKWIGIFRKASSHSTSICRSRSIRVVRELVVTSWKIPRHRTWPHFNMIFLEMPKGKSKLIKNRKKIGKTIIIFIIISVIIFSFFIILTPEVSGDCCRRSSDSKTSQTSSICFDIISYYYLDFETRGFWWLRVEWQRISARFHIPCKFLADF